MTGEKADGGKNGGAPPLPIIKVVFGGCGGRKENWWVGGKREYIEEDQRGGRRLGWHMRPRGEKGGGEKKE